MADGEPIRLAQAPPFHLGMLKVTPATRQVEGGGARTLEPRVMQVLVVLAGARGAVVGRDELIARCWDGRIVGEGSINRVISMIRQLGAETGAFALETVTKVGYRLVEIGADPAAADTPPRPAAPPARRWAWLAAAAVLVLAGLSAAWFSARPGAEQNGRVAVARFETRQADPQLQSLAPAVGDAVVAALTRNGIDTAAQANGAAASAELQVTGALDRQGGDIAVDVQVQDRRSGLALASLHFQRPAAKADGLADQTAANLAASLDCALVDRRQSGRAMAPSVFALYLNTCDAIAHEGNMPRMLDSARRLAAAAPGLAIAQALYAIAQANAASEMSYRDADAEALRLGARQTAERALKLDAKTPKAYVALANSYPGGAAWAEREQNLLKARQIDPGLTPGQISYIGLLREVGRLREAHELAEQLVEARDPRTRNGALMQLIFLDAELEDLAHAREHLGLIQREEPDEATGITWLMASTWEPPGPGLEHLHALGPHGPYSPHTYACVVQFLDELAQRTERHARGLPDSCAAAPAERRIAMLAREGDLDGAYAEMAKAGPRDVFLGFLFAPTMRAFRADPRFLPLTARLGLLGYWKRSGHWPDFCLEPSRPYDCRAADAAGALSPASHGP